MTRVGEVDERGLTVHASAALVGGQGVLIRGRPGSGKSSLLLSLLYGASATTLVADDRVVLTAANGRLVASVPEAIAGRMEVRGVGIVRRSHRSPAAIDLVVDMLPLEECPRLPSAEERRAVIEGVALPRIFVATGAADGAHRVRAALAVLEELYY
jgi:serine kinase of HPr protein (carbohydrate metabolism regulator)